MISNHWQFLKHYTDARIALGRAGVSLPTAVNLQFQLDHAQARDAVHQALPVASLKAELEAINKGVICVQSRACDRREYLQRPDKGRRLSEPHMEALRDSVQQHSDVDSAEAGYDIAIVVADGLSARAVQAHAVAFIQLLWPQVQAQQWRCAPLVIASQARVALGDDIGEALKAKLVLVLIGERPGLSSPDSLGIYMTYSPKRGRADSERNCISNIRPQGLVLERAAAICMHLLQGALSKGLSGVRLKDDSTTVDQQSNNAIPFLKQS